MRTSLNLLLSFTCLISVSACAGPPKPPPGPMDGPRPGAPPPVLLFISPSGQPFRAPLGQPYPVVVWFSAADADDDGRLTREEFKADAERFFSLLDLDKDAHLTGPEVSRYEAEVAPEITRLALPPWVGGPPLGGRGGRGGPPGGGPPGGGPPGGGGMGGPGAGGDRGGPRPPKARAAATPQGAAVYSLLNEPQPLMTADADLSRRVSIEEWRRSTDARFALLDRDEDQALRLSELPPTPVQRLAARVKRGRAPIAP